MAQTRTYSAYTLYGPSIAGSIAGTAGFGTGLLNTGDANGRHLSGLLGQRDFGVVFTNDLAIPTNASLTGIQISYRLKGVSNLPSQALGTPIPFQQLPPNTVNGTVINATTSFVTSTRNFNSAPGGGPISLNQAFSTQYGLFQSGAGFDLNSQVSLLTMGLTFSLVAPTCTTLAPINITRVAALLQANVNPLGATSAYPVSYRFQYGKTLGYGGLTPLTSGLVGSDNILVAAQLVGLTPNTLYHARVVVSNGDNTVNGNDITFVTPLSDSAIFRF